MFMNICERFMYVNILVVFLDLNVTIAAVSVRLPEKFAQLAGAVEHTDWTSV